MTRCTMKFSAWTLLVTRASGNVLSCLQTQRLAAFPRDDKSEIQRRDASVKSIHELFNPDGGVQWRGEQLQRLCSRTST